MNLAPAHSSSLLVQLETLLEPLDLDRLFANPGPLQVELGCGDASFLLEYARRNPGINFLGVERLMGRLQKLDRKGRRLELVNLRGLRIESAYFLQYLLPVHRVSAIHIYFPDPWPKKKHRRHRLIQDGFPALIRRVLVPGGFVYLRTDDLDYFNQMRAVFGGFEGCQEMETPPGLMEVTTDFERAFNARGVPTLRTAYQFS